MKIRIQIVIMYSVYFDACISNDLIRLVVVADVSVRIASTMLSSTGRNSFRKNGTRQCADD